MATSNCRVTNVNCRLERAAGMRLQSMKAAEGPELSKATSVGLPEALGTLQCVQDGAQ